ncbi:sedoheptulose 7-phosphate cyclase [Kineococcus arenarius]|uniref:sedoheptulose 7-phosphate cyclase n=1 Tax=unclassified Kineococcus TaxID=2621656 RepID=UPI003D7CA95E
MTAQPLATPTSVSDVLGAPSHGLFVDKKPRTRWQVCTAKPVEYEVLMTEAVFDPANPDLLGARDARFSPRRLVVTDETVERLYGRSLRHYLSANGIEHEVLVLPAGEVNKSLQATELVVAAMDRFGIDRRREPVIAVGGGVLLDIVGFAASLYRRSTPFIRVPTTLIGLVDAGVGAKTGVNANGHKNRLGTYFPAQRTLLDRSFLRTLPMRHVSNGLAEILKIALIKDVHLFDLLEVAGPTLLTSALQAPASPDQPDLALEVIEAAIDGMLQELQPNLWEQVLERCVDYGHAFSPTIEMQALPALLHGEAVSIDMAFTTVLAERRGLLSIEQRQRIFAVMRTLQLPVHHPLLTEEVLLSALADTVRHRDGKQRLPLPIGIGRHYFVDDVSAEEISAAITSLQHAAVHIARQQQRPTR